MSLAIICLRQADELPIGQFDASLKRFQPGSLILMFCCRNMSNRCALLMLWEMGDTKDNLVY